MEFKVKISKISIISFMISLFIISCKDTTVSPATNNNLVTIKVIDSKTKAAITNAKISLYYKTEAYKINKKEIEDVNEAPFQNPIVYPESRY